MKNIYVIGEVLVDLIDTEHKGLIQATVFEKKFGGAAANVAIASARLGSDVSFLGSIGKDYFGTYLSQTLNDNKVNIDSVRYEGKTTIAWVGLDSEGERYFSFNRGSDGDYVLDDKVIENSILHFGSATAFIGGNLRESYFALLEGAYNNNNVVSFDPNFRADLVFDLDKFIEDSLYFINKADFVKFSLEELAIISRVDSVSVEEILDKLRTLRKNSKAVFLVTLGAKGTAVYEGDSYYTVESIKIKQVDSTGAGDAFTGALLSQIAKGDYILKDAVYFANKVGALACTKYGAIEGLPYKEDLED